MKKLPIILIIAILLPFALMNLVSAVDTYTNTNKLVGNGKMISHSEQWQWYNGVKINIVVDIKEVGFESNFLYDPVNGWSGTGSGYIYITETRNGNFIGYPNPYKYEEKYDYKTTCVVNGVCTQCVNGICTGNLLARYPDIQSIPGKFFDPYSSYIQEWAYPSLSRSCDGKVEDYSGKYNYDSRDPTAITSWGYSTVDSSWVLRKGVCYTPGVNVDFSIKPAETDSREKSLLKISFQPVWMQDYYLAYLNKDEKLSVTISSSESFVKMSTLGSPVYPNIERAWLEDEEGNVIAEKNPGEIYLDNNLPIVFDSLTQENIPKNKKLVCKIKFKGDPEIYSSKNIIFIENNIKDMEKFQNGYAFIISDSDWHDVLSSVPAVMWKSSTQSSEEWCNRLKNVDENMEEVESDKCAYPLLVKDGTEIDDELIDENANDYFIDEFKKQNQLNYQDKTSVDDRLWWEAQWKEAGLVLVVDDSDYKDGLYASQLASYLNSPLIFVSGTNEEWRNYLTNKMLIVVGDIDESIASGLKNDNDNLILSYDPLRGFYLDCSTGGCNMASSTISSDELIDLTYRFANQKGIIFVNPNDIKDEYCEKDDNGISIDCKISLGAPIWGFANDYRIASIDTGPAPGLVEVGRTLNEYDNKLSDEYDKLSDEEEPTPANIDSINAEIDKINNGIDEYSQKVSEEINNAAMKIHDDIWSSYADSYPPYESVFYLAGSKAIPIKNPIQEIHFDSYYLDKDADLNFCNEISPDFGNSQNEVFSYEHLSGLSGNLAASIFGLPKCSCLENSQTTSLSGQSVLGTIVNFLSRITGSIISIFNRITGYATAESTGTITGNAAVESGGSCSVPGNSMKTISYAPAEFLAGLFNDYKGYSKKSWYEYLLPWKEVIFLENMADIPEEKEVFSAKKLESVLQEQEQTKLGSSYTEGMISCQLKAMGEYPSSYYCSGSSCSPKNAQIFLDEQDKRLAVATYFGFMNRLKNGLLIAMDNVAQGDSLLGDTEKLSTIDTEKIKNIFPDVQQRKSELISKNKPNPGLFNKLAGETRDVLDSIYENTENSINSLGIIRSLASSSTTLSTTETYNLVGIKKDNPSKTELFKAWRSNRLEASENLENVFKSTHYWIAGKHFETIMNSISIDKNLNPSNLGVDYFDPMVKLSSGNIQTIFRAQIEANRQGALDYIKEAVDAVDCINNPPAPQQRANIDTRYTGGVFVASGVYDYCKDKVEKALSKSPQAVVQFNENLLDKAVVNFPVIFESDVKKSSDTSKIFSQRVNRYLSSGQNSYSSLLEKKGVSSQVTQMALWTTAGFALSVATLGLGIPAVAGALGAVATSSMLAGLAAINYGLMGYVVVTGGEETIKACSEAAYGILDAPIGWHTGEGAVMDIGPNKVSDFKACYISAAFTTFNAAPLFLPVFVRLALKEKPILGKGVAVVKAAQAKGAVSGCFLPGTKIRMADGTEKSIEDIQEGEKVAAWDINENKKVEADITKTFKREADKYFIIDYENVD